MNYEIIRLVQLDFLNFVVYLLVPIVVRLREATDRRRSFKFIHSKVTEKAIICWWDVIDDNAVYNEHWKSGLVDGILMNAALEMSSLWNAVDVHVNGRREMPENRINRHHTTSVMRSKTESSSHAVCAENNSLVSMISRSSLSAVFCTSSFAGVWAAFFA